MKNVKTGTNKYPKTVAPSIKKPQNSKLTTGSGVTKGNGGAKKMC